MALGQELKDFASAFNAGYNVASDRRDKKEERRRRAISDPIDNEYKQASTEGMKKRNAWYDTLNDLQVRTGEKNLQWADRRNQAALDDSAIRQYNFLFGPKGAKAGERLDTSGVPEGEPEADGPPVGDHAPAAVEQAIPDDTTTETVPDAEPDADEEATVDPAAYRPEANSSQNIYTRFMRTAYESGVKNPNGLAAIAATATRESRFSPGNLHRTWSDPSESGEAGTSGYLMSWRGKRLTGLQQFAAKMGEDPRRPSPEVQAKYLFHEDPSLKEKLNAARSPQEAQRIMNQSWAFAGYDRDSPEARARYGLADNYAKKFSQFLSRGGLVVHAATGGVIPALPDDEEEDQITPAPQQVAQALPVEAPVPTERPMDQPAPVTPEGNPTAADVGYDPSVAGDPRVVGFTKAHEAVLEGVRYSLQQAGLGGGAAVQDPDRAKKMSQFLMGAGAAPKKVIDQAYDAVDPKKELPESERTMAALGVVYDHYVKRGESGKAKAAAASIVQYQRKLFQQYSAIAKAAIADGDIDAATKAAVKAYSSVPDGQDMKVRKLEDGRYQITLTDEATGKEISKPVLTPQEIGGWAMKVDPGSFDQFIMDAAGVRKQGGGAPSEDFQKLAAGMDEGVMPSNKDMAALPMGEQKELRQRVAAWQKENATGGAKPATLPEANKVRAEMNTAFDDLASQMTTDEQGNEVPVVTGMDKLSPFDRKTVVHAAADILISPHNRSPDYNVSEEDALIAGLTVSKSMDYTAEKKDGGMLVTLPDERQIWMSKPHFNQLTNVYKRTVADMKKKVTDQEAADKDVADKSARRAERDKKNREESPGLLGDQSIPAPTMGGTPQKALDDLQKLMGN